MKLTYVLAALLTVALCSCTKEKTTAIQKAGKFDKKDYDSHLYYGVSDRQERSIGMFLPWWFEERVGRVSVWLMFKKDSYWSSRADYAEILCSDIFLGDIDSDDKVKVVDSTDNLAIKNNFTTDLLWKELTRYTRDVEHFQLKTWNYTGDSYLFKIMGSNFPPFVKVSLYDKYTNKSIPLNVYNNKVQWYEFNVAGEDMNNGIKQGDSKRFEIIETSDW